MRPFFPGGEFIMGKSKAPLLARKSRARNGAPGPRFPCCGLFVAHEGYNIVFLPREKTFMRFSEKYGFKPVREKLQLDEVDTDLRTSLWNVMKLQVWDGSYVDSMNSPGAPFLARPLREKWGFSHDFSYSVTLSCPESFPPSRFLTAASRRFGMTSPIFGFSNLAFPQLLSRPL